MFDAMAKIAVRGLSENGLVSIQYHVDCRIAIGVNANLPAAFMRPADHFRYLLKAVVQGAARIGAQIVLALITGLRLIGTVGPRLDAIDAEKIIAATGFDPLLFPFVHDR